MRQRAVDHLRRVDPVMRDVIDQVGACGFRARREGTHFHWLARSIVYQQLSGKAAGTIFGRVQAIGGGQFLDPEAILAVPDEQLRAAGLSRQKTAYVRDLARHVVDGHLDMAQLPRLGDEEVCRRLTAVHGVGRWTAQMFLMFRLGRPDVLPVADLGVQKGVQVAYRLRRLPPPKRVEKIGAPWAPYRSVASWYLWRLLDVEAARRTRTRSS
jgi:3-methyladenine DNA glycosylase/8-oxoguanine DNA glycosylase